MMRLFDLDECEIWSRTYFVLCLQLSSTVGVDNKWEEINELRFFEWQFALVGNRIWVFYLANERLLVLVAQKPVRLSPGDENSEN